MHPRTIIRLAIQNALTGATSAGANVYSNRMLRYWQIELPALNIVSNHEESEKQTEAQQELRRELQMRIEARLDAISATDDALDAISEEIEQAIGQEFFVANPLFGLDFVSNLYLAKTTFDIEIQGEKEIGLITLYYVIVYHTDTPLFAPSGLDDLEEVHVDIEQPPVDQDIDAQDIIDGLQD